MLRRRRGGNACRLSLLLSSGSRFENSDSEMGSYGVNLNSSTFLFSRLQTAIIVSVQTAILVSIQTAIIVSVQTAILVSVQTAMLVSVQTAILVSYKLQYSFPFRTIDLVMQVPLLNN